MRFYKEGWFQKTVALVIASGYFLLLIFINNSSYVWASLALVLVLFVTAFTCASRDSPLSLQLRRTLPQREEEEREEEGGRVWTTDVPPSYSYVMELGPPTPPPSYGSAILMFPPPYCKESPPRLRPLSISTQVSVCGSVPGTPEPGGRVTFSTQISVVEPLSLRVLLSRQASREGEGEGDTLQLRTRLFLSREGEGEGDEGNADVFAETLQLRTSLFLSRDPSRENLAEEELQTIDCQIPIVLITDESRGPSAAGNDNDMKKEN